MRFKIISHPRKGNTNLEGKSTFDPEDIYTLLEKLNKKLGEGNEKGTLWMYGGAALCLTLGETARG